LTSSIDDKSEIVESFLMTKNIISLATIQSKLSLNHKAAIANKEGLAVSKIKSSPNFYLLVFKKNHKFLKYQKFDCT